MLRVEGIRVPDTGQLSWSVIDGEYVPVEVVNEYLFMFTDSEGRRAGSEGTRINLQSVYVVEAEMPVPIRFFPVRANYKMRLGSLSTGP